MANDATENPFFPLSLPLFPLLPTHHLFFLPKPLGGSGTLHSPSWNVNGALTGGGGGGREGKESKGDKGYANRVLFPPFPPFLIGTQG